MADYTPQTWTDGSGGGTPLSAARLQHMEDGTDDAASPSYFDFESATKRITRDELDTGFATIPRWAASGSTTLATGVVRFSYFTALETASRSSITVVTGTTAAAATPTLVRFGVYSVAGNGDLTLVGSTVSDTTLLAATNTAYTKAFSTPVSFTAGGRYAWAPIIVTGAAAPNLYSTGHPQAAEMAVAPRLTAQVTGQSDLPSSVTSGSLSTSGVGLIYARFS